MKKAILLDVLKSYRFGLENSFSKNKERRIQKLEILEDIVMSGKKNAKDICIEKIDSGVVERIPNPLNVTDILKLHKNIISWLESPEYDMVAY